MPGCWTHDASFALYHPVDGGPTRIMRLETEGASLNAEVEGSYSPNSINGTGRHAP